MKRVLCVLLAVFACLSVAGCGISQDKRPGQGNQGKSVNDVLNEKIKKSDAAAEASDDGPTGAVTAEKTAADPSDSEKKDTTPADKPVEPGSMDVDLTKLSSTMVYSEVYNMLTGPESYLGKRVRMKGTFWYAEGDGRYYFSCIIADATACCAQGIEFVLKDQRKVPDEYPAEGSEITVVGIFDTYTEDTYQYCQLIDAVLE